MKAAEGAVEVDGLAALVDLGPRAAVWVVAEDDAAAARELQPAIGAPRFRGGDFLSVPQRPEHRPLVVAEQPRRVGAVAGVAQGAHPERPVVDEVAEEDRPPLGRRIRLERLEEAFEIAVDVPDDQDRQVLWTWGRHRTMLMGVARGAPGVG